MNLGTTDRLLRLLLGGALLAAFFLTTGPVHWLGLAGVVPLLTASMGWCPLYQLLGLSTCHKAES